MPFIAFLYPSPGGTPHMEVLPEDDPLQATAIARQLLSDHASATFAELWQGDVRVAILNAGAPPFPAGSA